MPALTTEGLNLHRLATKQGLQDHWDVASTAPNVGDVLTRSSAGGGSWVPSPAVTSASLGMFNVVSYGADPTNTSDSRAAIQSAWDALIAAGGGELYFPPGNYRISPSGGNGLLFDDGGDNIRITGNGAWLRPQGTYTGYVLRLGDSTGASRTNFLEWRGLKLKNNGATGATTGLEIYEVFNSSFYDLIVESMPNEGVTLNVKGYNNRFWGCTVWLNGGIGLKDNTTGSVHFTPMWWFGGRIEGNAEDGVDLNGDQYHFIGVTFQSNATAANTFYDARVRQKSSYFQDCQFEHPDPAAAADERTMLFCAAAAIVGVDHCVFSGNRTGANGHNGMLFEGKVDIGGNTIFRDLDTGWTGSLSTSQGNIGTVFYSNNLTNSVATNMTNYSQFGPQVTPIFRYSLFTLDGAQFVATNAGSGGANRFGADFSKSATLTVGGGVSIQLVLSEIITDSTDKNSRLGFLPYANNTQNVAAMIVTSTSATTNQVNIGGGTSAMQAATQVAFYTASAVNTATGTRRWEVSNVGHLLPFATETYNLGGSSNRVAEIWGVTLNVSGTATINAVALTTPLDETDGGTGTDTYTTGQILYASATDTLAKRSIGSTDNVLTVSGGVPVWAAPSRTFPYPGDDLRIIELVGAGSPATSIKIRYDDTSNRFEFVTWPEGTTDPGDTDDTYVRLSITSADGIWNFASGKLQLGGTAVSVVGHVHDTADITTGTFANARIAESNVTQHQAALTIAESQITDGTLLARVASTETITGTWTFDLDPSAPFVVTSGSAVVANLDADKLDGLEATGFVRTAPTGAQTIQAGATGAHTAYQLVLRAADATSGTTTVDAPSLKLTGQYWTGSATAEYAWTFINDVTGTTPTARLILQVGSADRTYIYDNGSIEHFAADSTFASGLFFAYAANYTIATRRAQGTRASPTAVGSGATLGVFAFEGAYNTTPNYGRQAQFLCLTTESWSSTNRGAEMLAYTTPNASTTITARWRWHQAGHYEPFADQSYDLGGTSLRIRTTYSDDVRLGTSTEPGLLYHQTEYDNGTITGNWTLDWTRGNVQRVKAGNAASAAVTFTAPGGAATLILRILGDGTQRTFTWPSTVKWTSGAAPTMPTTNNSWVLVWWYYDGTNYTGVHYAAVGP